jgi:L-threonylcarbamoyladenylate synthase
MKKYKLTDLSLIELIKKGKVGVLPTDTLYGLVGLALKNRAVKKIYRLKERTPSKPCIILISQIKDLKKFAVKVSQVDRKILKKIWPGKVSMVLPCPEKKFFYLHRGTKTLAFRLPKKRSLVKLLKKTGPLLAPSANWENFSPAENIFQARKYFGDNIDFYVSGGKMRSKPSTLVIIKDGKLKVLRQGAVKI